MQFNFHANFLIHFFKICNFYTKIIFSLQKFNRTSVEIIDKKMGTKIGREIKDIRHTVGILIYFLQKTFFNCECCVMKLFIYLFYIIIIS